MTPSVSQIIATTYPVVLADMRGKPHNQWAESAFLRALEKKGAVKHEGGGSSIEHPLDWRKNPGTDFLATDVTATSVTKTDVITATSYAFAELVVPINWSFRDEATNSKTYQKISLSKALIENAINSHDDAIELGLFGTSTDGFLGLQTLCPTSGQPNAGGIDGAAEAWWRNATGTYLVDGSDLEAQLTDVYNTAAKGTGSPLAPSILVSGATAQAIYEGGLVTQQRFMEGDEGNGGFKALAFKNASWVFSQYGETMAGDPIYMLNPKSFQLVVASNAWRELKPEVQFTAQAGYNRKVYSLLQAVTNNASRLGVLTHA